MRDSLERPQPLTTRRDRPGYKAPQDPRRQHAPHGEDAWCFRTRDGKVVLQLKTPYRDGTTHLVMAPLVIPNWKDLTTRGLALFAMGIIAPCCIIAMRSSSEKRKSSHESNDRKAVYQSARTAKNFGASATPGINWKPI
ncbi:MAG: hypothetical protein WD425_09540 [Nitrospirales bacterium]